jgi:hypothetical protein
MYDINLILPNEDFQSKSKRGSRKAINRVGNFYFFKLFKMKRLFFLITIVVLSFTACKKDDATTTDNSCKATAPIESTIKVYPLNNLISVVIDNVQSHAVKVVEKNTQKLAGEIITTAFSPNKVNKITGLNPSTDYEVQVYGYCEETKEISKNVVKINTKTIENCLLPAPSNFKYTIPNNGWVKLTWEPVAGADRYYVSIIDTKTQQALNGSPVGILQNNYLDFPMPSGTKYEYKVFAACSSGVISDNLSASLIIEMP